MADGTMRNSLKTIFAAIGRYEETQEVRALMDAFQTYSWLEEYEPLDQTMAEMQAVLYPQSFLTA